jgi:hypothetical protein
VSYDFYFIKLIVLYKLMCVLQMVGMCDKPAGIAAAAVGAKPGAGVEDIDGGMVDVGSDDYAPGGDDE